MGISEAAQGPRNSTAAIAMRGKLKQRGEILKIMKAIAAIRVNFVGERLDVETWES
jgi:hypothetical protein